MTDLKGGVWLSVRLGLLGVTCLSNALLAEPMAPAPDGAVGALVQGGAVCLVAAVMLMILIGIQAVNPRSATSWEYPAWTESFLDFSGPLRFFHFGAWYFAAAAAGALLGWLTRGVENLWLVSTASGAAIGTWLGVYVAWRLCKSKRTSPVGSVPRRPTRS